MTNNYEVLGDQVLGDLIGTELVGEGDSGGLSAQYGISAAAELLSRGIKTYEDKQAAEKKRAEDAKKLDEAVRADVAWANAETTLEQADASAKEAARVVAQTAMQRALAAGAGLSPELQKERAHRVQSAAMQAAEKATKSPGNKSLQAAMRAWQRVAATVATGAPLAPYSPEAAAAAAASTGNFFTRQYGGVPVWGWAAGGAVVLTGLVLGIRAAVRR